MTIFEKDEFQYAYRPQFKEKASVWILFGIALVFVILGFFLNLWFLIGAFFSALIGWIYALTLKAQIEVRLEDDLLIADAIVANSIRIPKDRVETRDITALYTTKVPASRFDHPVILKGDDGQPIWVVSSGNQAALICFSKTLLRQLEKESRVQVSQG